MTSIFHKEATDVDIHKSYTHKKTFCFEHPN